MSITPKKSEIPVDSTRMATILFASLIDAKHTDHEILTMCEEILRSLRDKLSGSTQSATEIAIALATEWNKKS
jgi:hypothetical protein